MSCLPMAKDFEGAEIRELSLNEIDAVSGGMSETTEALLILGAGVVVGVGLGVGACAIAAALLL